MKKMMFTTEMLCALLVMVLARSTSSLLVHCYDEEEASFQNKLKYEI